jgi:hypothetical protein
MSILYWNERDAQEEIDDETRAAREIFVAIDNPHARLVTCNVMLGIVATFKSSKVIS